MLAEQNGSKCSSRERTPGLAKADDAGRGKMIEMSFEGAHSRACPERRMLRSHWPMYALTPSSDPASVAS